MKVSIIHSQVSNCGSLFTSDAYFQFNSMLIVARAVFTDMDMPTIQLLLAVWVTSLSSFIIFLTTLLMTLLTTNIANITVTNLVGIWHFICNIVVHNQQKCPNPPTSPTLIYQDIVLKILMTGKFINCNFLPCSCVKRRVTEIVLQVWSTTMGE